MKDFQLSQKMLSFGGVFYPTGHAFIMFPDIESAQQVANEIESVSSSVMLLSPDTILTEIGRVDGHTDAVLPNVGTEGATVERYVNLARKGHYALMIAVPDAATTERVMVAVRKTPFSFAEKYHMLAIEDLE